MAILCLYHHVLLSSIYCQAYGKCIQDARRPDNADRQKKGTHETVSPFCLQFIVCSIYSIKRKYFLQMSSIKRKIFEGKDRYFLCLCRMLYRQFIKNRFGILSYDTYRNPSKFQTILHPDFRRYVDIHSEIGRKQPDC